MSNGAHDEYRHHEEAHAHVSASAAEVFGFLDDHRSIAAHMGAGR